MVGGGGGSESKRVMRRCSLAVDYGRESLEQAKEEALFLQDCVLTWKVRVVLVQMIARR